MELLKEELHPTDYAEEYTEEEPVAAYQSRSNILNRPDNGTPMKMLIDEEISKDLGSNPKPPGVVARLMGLDPTPVHDLLPSRKTINSEGYLLCNALRDNRCYDQLQIQGGAFTQTGNTVSLYPRNELQQKHLRYSIQCHSISEQQDCKDVHVVLRPSKMKKETYDGYLADDKMDLVRRKFIEAKRLATDEKLRQSREFQEALEVLSSNRDLFLKFLQEPCYMFPGHLDNQPLQPRPQSKHITVLKPSKAEAENPSWQQFKNGEHGRKRQTKKQHLEKNQLAKAKEPSQGMPPRGALFDNHNTFRFRPPGQADSSSRPTRIVVLKPSRSKVQDTKMEATFSTLLHKPKGVVWHLSGPEKLSDSAEDENEDLQGGEKNGQICGNLNTPSMPVQSMREDQLSSLSNDYYESSFNRSESEDMEEGNLSDSEYMTPTSRLSWDFINRRSPLSSSSLSRASYSPESSVSREAKKRLSERWALIAHGSHNHEHRHTQSSSTLGEMLALPELNNQTDTEICEEGLSISSSRIHSENNYQETNCISSEKVIDEGVGEVREGSFINLLRTGLVPVTAGACNVAPLEGDAAKTEQHDNIAKAGKPKSGSSLRRKVSSFFFSKNKKSSKDDRKPQCTLGNPRDEKSVGTKVSNYVSDSQKVAARNHCVSDQYPISISNKVCTTASASSTSTISELKGGFSMEAVLNKREYTVPDILSENQEQPSPISVLDPPFDEETPSPPVMDRSSSVRHASLSLTTGISCISSPASLAVTLSWEEDDILRDGRTEGETVSSTLVEEQERFRFVQKVLASAGFDGEQAEANYFSRRWYSSSSPLDPSLLESLSKWSKHTINAKDAMKLRRATLENKLLFDCINLALLEMAEPMADSNPWSSRERRCGKKREVGGGSCLLDEVRKRLQNIISTNDVVPAVPAAESRGHVDKLLRKEMESKGWGWVELEVVEVDVIGREIENDVLEDLLQDAVSDCLLRRRSR